MLIILVASGLGLFGTGWLSHEMQVIGVQSLAYEKFARYDSPMVITIQSPPANGQVEVAIPQAYLAEVQVTHISPNPSRRRISRGSTVFLFDVDEEVTVKFYLEPNKVGRLRAGIRVNGTFFTPSHFIYP